MAEVYDLDDPKPDDGKKTVMPGAKTAASAAARAKKYQAQDKRNEKIMIAVTIVLTIVALSAVIWWMVKKSGSDTVELQNGTTPSTIKSPPVSNGAPNTGSMTPRSAPRRGNGPAGDPSPAGPGSRTHQPEGIN